MLHSLFEAVASRFGHRVAIASPGHDCVTYRQLDCRADALADRLRGVVQAEDVVAILLGQDDPNLYMAQLAALKAGGAFLGLDRRFPDGHLEGVLADARPAVVVTDPPGRRRLGAVSSKLGCPLLDITTWVDSQDDRHLPRPPRSADPGRLAYVVYTSGSTGQPKGVMIEHRSIVNLVLSDTEHFGITPDDRVAQTSSPAYDSSVEETWLAWAAGATLVPFDELTVRSGPELARSLGSERITVLCCTPTMLRSMALDDPAPNLPAVRIVYTGGEPLTPDLARRWAPGRWLENGYGPTECTVTVLRGRVPPDGQVTIGQPVTGNQAFVVDERLHEVAEGRSGELCIAGVGLARGYLRRPDLTAERFLVHPTLGRIYRTGDLARRTPGGDLEHLGRLDGQVKLRGYRIELDAVEAHLAACRGVKAAACRLQDRRGGSVLVAHVVPSDAANPPPVADLQAALRRRLPEYMVPGRVGVLAELPTTVSGKVDRRALPDLAVDPLGEDATPAKVAGPDGSLESIVVAAFAEALGRPPGSIAVDDDFFLDLGGDSLAAVTATTALADDPRTAQLSVRDLYHATTAAGVAALLGDASRRRVPAPIEEPEALRPPRLRPAPATLAQTACLLGLLLAVSAACYGVLFGLWPTLVAGRGVGAAMLLLFASSVLLALVYVPLSVSFAVLVKRLLIGRYQPLTAPAWSSWHVRHWMVCLVARMIPWGLLEGTVLHATALRALGARVGRRVHLARGVDLHHGGWDLLEIGDDATVGRDAVLQLVELLDGQVSIGPVTIGAGATVGVRVTVGRDAWVGPSAYLTALSWLPAGARLAEGQRGDGVPAETSGPAPDAPEVDRSHDLSPAVHALVLVLARLARFPWILALCLLTEWTAIRDVSPLGSWGAMAAWSAAVTVALPAALFVQALLLRLAGPVRPGSYSRWSTAALRIWYKTGAVESAGRWLSGSLLWPRWLRLAGMQVGRGCEISTIIDVVPETVCVGEESFFADGVYFCSPVFHRGTITVASTELGRNTFLGNHTVVPAGGSYPDDLFVGVATVAASDGERGTAVFGHPPFVLHRPGTAATDRRLTHEPTRGRRATRWVFELARFPLVVLPFSMLVGWFWGSEAAGALDLGPRLLVVVPAVTLAAVAVPVVATLGLKWLLLGRVHPGRHPFWSCWCARWDYVYMAWRTWAASPLGWLEGTLLLNVVLRAAGARLGRGVLLGAGHRQVVDPDMLWLDEAATVEGDFQTHSFEDRVLKIDRVRVRRQATIGASTVVFFGADVGETTRVAPAGVVMKGAVLAPGRTYVGNPVGTATALTQAGRRR